MTIRAAGALEDLSSQTSIFGEATVGIAKRAAGHLGESGKVSSEPVELLARAGSRLPERVVRAVRSFAKIELFVGHEARTAEAVADVALEILDLVHVGAPVHASFGRAARPEQHLGVAKPL